MNFQNYKRRATEELDRNLWSRPYDPFRDVKRTIRDAGELDDSFNSTGIEYLNRFIPRVIKTEKELQKAGSTLFRILLQVILKLENL